MAILAILGGESQAKMRWESQGGKASQKFSAESMDGEHGHAVDKFIRSFRSNVQ
jgi:hypothetical protein